MSEITLTSFELVNDCLVKATYHGQHSGPKTQLSFKIHLIIRTRTADDDPERVSATIDFDGKCSGPDITAAMNKVGTWCERIAEVTKTCKVDELSLPLSMKCSRGEYFPNEGLDTHES